MIRCHCQSKLKIRAEPAENEQAKKYIEGYFIVFNQETELWDGFFEKISPDAFDIAEGDIRCLYNHDNGAILGRTGNGTFTLKKDERGIWGRVEVNENDPEAIAAYARVQRGDIYGCSFGFSTPIDGEIYEERDSEIHSTVVKGILHEMSVCVFPAYEQTDISARSVMIKNSKTAEAKKRKAALKSKLEGLKC